MPEGRPAVLAAADAAAGEVDPKAGASLRTVKRAGQPKGLAWSGSGKITVAEYDVLEAVACWPRNGAILAPEKRVFPWYLEQASPIGALALLRMLFAGTSRFRPIRLVGSGGMGTVHLVHDGQMGTEVALKTFNLSSGAELYRFKREFRILADIKHPNLVTLFELISDGPLLFFTMEYVPGLPFDKDSARFNARPVVQAGSECSTPEAGEPPRPADREGLLRSIQQLCAGVQAIHELGCVHRDLKPANVLVTPEGRVVILDFGLAEFLGSEGTSSLGGLSGTPAYMAPEQALRRSCQPAADWYAVGTMIYEVLTGRCPFEGSVFDVMLRKQTEQPPAPVEINPQADELLSELCMALIRRDPSQRPTGAEIIVRLGITGNRQPLSRIRRHSTVSVPAHGLLGREQELQRLYQAYAKARKGSMAMTIVEGGSGIGKTCLIEAFLADLLQGRPGSAAPLILRGRCHERETLPFKALDNVIDSLSYHLARLDPDEQSYVLPDGILYLCEIFPVLRHVKLTANERYFLPPLRDAKELRNQAFAAFCELVKHLARMQPVVIFIDDLQWVDRDSFTLVQALIQQPVPGLLVIACCRKGRDTVTSIGESFPCEFPDQTAIEAIRLGPLASEDVRALVDHLLDPDEVSARDRQTIAAAVVREANGNPFFSVEMVHHFRTVVLPKGDIAETNRGSDFGLEGMILGRMGQLSQESQRLLRIIALAGDPLPQRVLASAAELPLGSDSWERSISALIENCLVRRRGRQDTDLVEPFHDRIREVIAGSLDQVTAHRLHVSLAQAVEQWERERADMLARYWLSADDHERAKRYTCEAAAEARAKLAFDRAAQLYEGATLLESDPKARAELLRALGDCQASSGRPILAAKAYQEAAALKERSESLRLRHLAAEQLLRGGHITQGLAVLRDVLKEEGLSLPSPRGAALSIAGRLIWLRLRGLRFKERPPSDVSASDKRMLDIYWSANTGLGVVDTLRADDFLLRFLLLALKTGDIRRVSQGLALLGGQVAALGTGHMPWAMHLVSEAEVLARRSSDAATIGLARMSKAIARYVAGELNEAANDLLAVEQYFLGRCHGIGWELSTTRSFACFSLRLAGRLRELCEHFDRYTADADRTGDRYLATNLRTYTSIVWLVRDNVARARKDIEGCLDSWPADIYQIQHFFFLDARCEQAIYAEQPESALGAITAEIPRLRRSGLLRVEALRVEYLWIYSRSLLAVAESTEASKRRLYLKPARAAARVLCKGKTRAARAIGTAVSAAILNLTPGSDRREVLVLLDRSVATAEAIGGMLLAESARRWLGETMGGRRGDEILARSNGWMADQGVQNPARLSHLIVPGFRRNGS
jgi:serine/threonine protein kinase